MAALVCTLGASVTPSVSAIRLVLQDRLAGAVGQQQTYPSRLPNDVGDLSTDKCVEARNGRGRFKDQVAS